MMNDDEQLAQDDEDVARREAKRLERVIQLEAESAAMGEKLKEELYQMYERTARDLRRMVNDFYGRYVSRSKSQGAAGTIETKQVLLYDQAVKHLEAAEIKEWNDSVVLREERIDKETNRAVRERLQAKLKGITCGTSPPRSRFDVLSGHMRMALDQLDVAGAQQMEKAFESLLSNVYAKKISDMKQNDEEQFVDKEIRHDDHLDAEEIAKALSDPWNGTTFSERLTFNMSKLQYHLRETMVQGLIQGKSSSAVVKDLAARMGTSFKQVERIINSESAHFHSEATLLAYRASGVKQYKYVAKLDKRTSTECRELNGQRFDVSDAIIGVNFPPLHPGCRSITVEYDGGAGHDKKSIEKTSIETLTRDEARQTVQNLLNNGEISLSDLESIIPQGVSSTFVKTTSITDGAKYEFLLADGQKAIIRWHSPDPVAASKYPGAASGTRWTAQIKVGNKQLKTDGTWTKNQSLNEVHVPIEGK
ncbi:minor capsid protein [Paenibacillus sp. SC116]|uniref:minor capsid protein n=1 Tax=Paenibacillus sp. SC116 TaxID=2968986 RepID=UPI00215B6D08|nr:minor capsid protein [Paenibacillus sp. SC116]MCR8844071.1 minor capsid protein [Paenibacillus sp. SC116]